MMLKPCPICKKPLETMKYRPFCSARCKNVDLNRWLSESYRVPGPPASEEDLPTEPADRG